MAHIPIFDQDGTLVGTFDEEAASLWGHLETDPQDADKFRRIGLRGMPADQALYRTLDGWTLLWTDLDGLTTAKKWTPEEAAAWLVANALPLPPDLAPLIGGTAFAPPLPAVQNEAPARHSEDFRSVHWFGTDYRFTATQAACVKVLWEAWENGTPEIGHDTILTKAGSDSRQLKDVFGSQANWKNLIVSGTSKGSYRLNDPPLKNLRPLAKP